MRLNRLEAETMDGAYEQAVELMAKHRSDVRAAVDALREAHYKTPCEACRGTGDKRAAVVADGVSRQRAVTERPCPVCGGAGMVDTGTRLTTALGCVQVGWRDAKGKLQRNDDPGAGWTATPPVVPVFVEVVTSPPQPREETAGRLPYTEPQP